MRKRLVESNSVLQASAGPSRYELNPDAGKRLCGRSGRALRRRRDIGAQLTGARAAGCD